MVASADPLKIGQLVSMYCLDKSKENLSKGTLVSINSTLIGLCDYTEVTRPIVDDSTVSGYLKDVANVATYNKMLYWIKQFYEWLKNNSFVTHYGRLTLDYKSSNEGSKKSIPPEKEMASFLGALYDIRRSAWAVATVMRAGRLSFSEVYRLRQNQVVRDSNNNTWVTVNRNGSNHAVILTTAGAMCLEKWFNRLIKPSVISMRRAFHEASVKSGVKLTPNSFREGFDLHSETTRLLTRYYKTSDKKEKQLLLKEINGENNIE